MYDEITKNDSIDFLKCHIDIIKFPLYNVKGVMGTYTITEFKKIDNSFFITYINNIRSKEIYSNINHLNPIFLKNICIKASNSFEKKTIWED